MNRKAGAVCFRVGFLLTMALMAWSLKSLPVGARGRALVVSGALRCFRHPYYTSWLLFFDFGLALYMDNWLFVAWALALIPIWHLNVRSEEALMNKAFPEEYPAYCARTGRFVPRFWRLGRS